MNRKNIPVEFVYQLFALAIAIVLVHGIYVSVVRPNAAEVIAEQNLAAKQDPDYVRERSVWVLVKDFEQEACFILMLWALAIMGYKAAMLVRERALIAAPRKKITWYSLSNLRTRRKSSSPSSRDRFRRSTRASGACCCRARC